MGSNQIRFQKKKLTGSRNTKHVSIASRLMADLLAGFYQRHIPAHVTGRLVDLGCGNVPLYHAYKDLISENICVDWSNSAHKNPYLDSECDLNQPLPFPDNYADTIIISDVLEHISKPSVTWGEMARILKPQGKVLLTVPFLYKIHEAPFDYFRYTEYALRDFAEKNNFKIITLQALGGLPEILADLLSKNIVKIPGIGPWMAVAAQKACTLFTATPWGKRISQKNRNRISVGIFYDRRKKIISQISMFELLLRCVKVFGAQGLLIYIKLKSRRVASIRIPGFSYPVHLRKHQKSDIITFKEIFLKREYDIPLPEFFHPVVIVDAGANTGFTSVFFANKYPHARIFSIEPDEDNYRQLVKNTRYYPSIHPLHSAIWNTSEMISVADKGYGVRGFVIEKGEHNALPGMSLGDLLKKFELSHIDILKIDIEGSEKEVFENGHEEWLPHTKCLVVELHDRMKKGCSKAVFEAITKYNFSFSIKGENVVFIRENVLA